MWARKCLTRTLDSLLLICNLYLQYFFRDSNPVLISKPKELTGMTLEDRLVSYDWKNQFDEFQSATTSGSFKAICRDVKNRIIPVCEHIQSFKKLIIYIF